MKFQFKQFAVNQQLNAMKIGTDGVLLGAWSPIENVKKVLDIGAGTGLLSLMIAQRNSTALIDAIEIDLLGFQECQSNILQSAWAERIKCYHSDFQFFKLNEKSVYDLIISNPPFFSEQVFSENQQRNQARSQSALPFQILIERSAELLSDNGKFCVVIPYKEQQKFTEIARQNGLFLQKELLVQGHIGKPIKRSLLCFSTKKEVKIHSQTLIIEEHRHQYTAFYKQLTQDFYLKM